ncbi:MAG TPA: L,D-transpeptidase family protein [Gaiellaceae bacterium]|nr:L,D-transpeptidase family protein [Gaiellaceae bacterium]
MTPGTGRGRVAGAAALLAAVAVSAFPARAAAEEITLAVTPAVPLYDSTARFSGTIAPARATGVELLRLVDGDWRPVSEGLSGADGRFALPARVRAPAAYAVRTDAASSAQLAVRVRPRLTAGLTGLRVLGAPLFVEGRLRPGVAGTLRLTVGTRRRTVGLDAAGRFEEKLSTRRAVTLDVSLRLDPAAGYAPVSRAFRPRVRTPVLRIGSRGEAVEFLERRLRGLRYALPAANRAYGARTRDAVLAFQKVEGLARDGVAGPQVWRRLRRAQTPAPGRARGDHVEVDKARQVLFEVRNGRVVRIVHVSTGATANTPVGRWRIYRKVPGWDWVLYYPLYFLRGFAIHGYPSVPAYPASHGCVRVPLWLAPRIYRRWQLGDAVWVFPTTVRTSALWVPPAGLREAPAPANVPLRPF